MLKKIKEPFLVLAILIIITVPAFIALANNQYFSMHDDQHIARLFLFIEGIKQGQWYPRWVDMLGFGYGYPLFNFYPPLIYYVASVFHIFGFSLIWSVKLMIIFGFIISAIGSYLFVKELLGKLAGFLAATVYTYFFYHAINAFVRGALAEFFSMAVIPFVFLGLYKIYKNLNITSLLVFAISFALLILTHPLIAFPSLIYIGLFCLFLFFFSENKFKFTVLLFLAFTLSLGLSSFFWLPSMLERKYTLVDQILTKELANYRDHYVYFSQLWYSPWGYGGSVKGTGDGMSFQLGKVNIFLLITSLFLAILYLLKKKDNLIVRNYAAFLFLFFVSVFMTTGYSSFIWDNIKFLAYLQFPWRMLTFSGLFIAVIAAYWAVFFQSIIETISRNFRKSKRVILLLAVFLTSGLIVYKYHQYFRPQRYVKTDDKARTSLMEIAWRISSTSFEFVPKEVATYKTRYNTTRLAITKNQIPKTSYVAPSKAKVVEKKINFSDKIYEIKSDSPVIFRLNTYYFPGWKAYINGKQANINSNNRLNLISIIVPEGTHQLNFKFEDTMPRKIGKYLTIISVLISIMFYFAANTNNKAKINTSLFVQEFEQKKG